VTIFSLCNVLSVTECWFRTSAEYASFALGLEARSSGAARLVATVPVSSLGKLGVDSTV